MTCHWKVRGGAEVPSYLPQGALHTPQEVVVAGADAVRAVDVIDLEAQLLYLFKIIIQCEDLREHRMQVALDDFCPVQLDREDIT